MKVKERWRREVAARKAYEVLLGDAMAGDATQFARQDYVGLVRANSQKG